jgi:hypothetical protein
MTLITSIVCISPLSRLQEHFGQHATNAAASEPLDRGDGNREYRISAPGQACEIVRTQSLPGGFRHYQHPGISKRFVPRGELQHVTRETLDLSVAYFNNLTFTGAQAVE